MYYVLRHFWDLTCIYNIYNTAPGRLRLTVHWKGYDRKSWRPIIIPESPSMFGGYKGPYKGLFFIQVILGIVLLVIMVQKNRRKIVSGTSCFFAADWLGIKKPHCKACSFTNTLTHMMWFFHAWSADILRPRCWFCQPEKLHHVIALWFIELAKDHATNSYLPYNLVIFKWSS